MLVGLPSCSSDMSAAQHASSTPGTAADGSASICARSGASGDDGSGENFATSTVPAGVPATGAGACRIKATPGRPDDTSFPVARPNSAATMSAQKPVGSAAMFSSTSLWSSDVTLPSAACCSNLPISRRASNSCRASYTPFNPTPPVVPELIDAVLLLMSIPPLLLLLAAATL